MFDTLEFKTDLPDDLKPASFQVKAFDNLMEEYYVLEGTLYKEKAHFEAVPKKERPYPDEEGILGLCGCIRKVHEGQAVFPWTGEVHFYAETITGKDVERVALFFKGKLMEIIPWADYQHRYKEWRSLPEN